MKPRAEDFDVAAPFFVQRARPLGLAIALSLGGVPYLARHQAAIQILGFILWAWVMAATMLVIMGASTDRGEGVRVSARGLRLGGRFLPRAKLDALYIVPAGKQQPQRLCFVAEGGKTRGWFGADDATAARVLGELALGTVRIRGQRIVRLSTEGFKNLVVSPLVLLLLFAVAWWLPGVAVVIALLVRTWMRTNEVVLGRDGISFRARLEEGHVAWADVDTIEALPRGFFVRRKSGEVHTFFTLPNRLLVSVPEREELANFVERGRGFLALAAREDEAANVVAALARDAPFRDASVRREDLWRVVENGGASVDVRIRAARFLAEDASDDERARFRIAADASAAPRVRAALEALAPEDDSGSVEGLDEREVHARR